MGFRRIRFERFVGVRMRMAVGVAVLMGMWMISVLVLMPDARRDGNPHGHHHEDQQTNPFDPKGIHGVVSHVSRK